MMTVGGHAVSGWEDGGAAPWLNTAGALHVAESGFQSGIHHGGASSLRLMVKPLPLPLKPLKGGVRVTPLLQP